ncbi:MAG: hypothetical protein GY845_34895, partial [Planctomycetes bacterium]|nr:hypothetical protein [Planctomycetota bacterium]
MGNIFKNKTNSEADLRGSNSNEDPLLVLAGAEMEAERIRQEASKDAETLLYNAYKDAQSRAKEISSKIKSGGQSKAKRMKEDASILAQEIINKARKESKKKSRGEASLIREESEAEVKRLKEDVSTQAEEIIAKTRQEAQEKASEETSLIIGQAEAQAERIREDAEKEAQEVINRAQMMVDAQVEARNEQSVAYQGDMASDTSEATITDAEVESESPEASFEADIDGAKEESGMQSQETIAEVQTSEGIAVDAVDENINEEAIAPDDAETGTIGETMQVVTEVEETLENVSTQENDSFGEIEIEIEETRPNAEESAAEMADPLSYGLDSEDGEESLHNTPDGAIGETKDEAHMQSQESSNEVPAEVETVVNTELEATSEVENSSGSINQLELLQSMADKA